MSAPILETEQAVMSEPASTDSLRVRLKSELSGVAVTPVVILTLVWAVDQFDSQVYGNLLPQIASGLHTSSATAQELIIPQVVLAALLPMYASYFGDRIKRVRIVYIGMLVYAASAFLTGIASSIGFFLLWRMIAIAPKAPASVNLSLLKDYCPPKARGSAFSVYNSAPLWGGGIGLLISGIVGQTYGWRAAWFVVAIPPVVLAFIAMRMKEPRRGHWEALELGAEDAPPAPLLGLVRTFRLLLTIRSLRWIAIGVAFAFAGVSLAGVSGSFFFQAVFNVGPLERSLLFVASIPVSLIGLFVFARYGAGLLAKDRSDRIITLAAVAYVAVALFYFLEASAGSLYVAAVAQLLALASAYTVSVPVALVFTRIVPFNIQTQAYGTLVVCQSALILPAVVIGANLSRSGYRKELALSAPCFIVAAACVAMAARYSRGDVLRATQVLRSEIDAVDRRNSGQNVPVLDARGIDVAYGSVQVLFGVDFHVDEGETVALLGTNGAGKSTLLRAICGLTPPIAGSLLIDGRDVIGFETDWLATYGIICVPGGKGVFPALTVEQNLEMGGYLLWKNRAAYAHARREVLELFPRLRDRLGQAAGTLSGGEQQMLTLALGLMNKPRVLMIDELSLGLAPVVVQDILRVVNELKARGMTMVIVEQSVNIALSIADRAYFMEKGEIRFEGKTEDLVGRTDLLRSIFLEGARGVPAPEDRA